MRIGIVTPAPPGSHHGNRITAIRWAEILRKLGHRVAISQAYNDQPHDLLIALHAQRSHSSVLRFRRKHPEAPIIVALTGTDLYRDIPISRRAQSSLDIASRIVVLQPEGLKELRPVHRDKAQVIYQSVKRARGKAKVRRTSSRGFDVCVIGHLRPVKDPFRTALASRLLPPSSRIRVLHIGGAMTRAMAKRALAEVRVNDRYQWLGELPRSRTLHMLARSHVCVVSSRLEGGANVLSEAIVASISVIASRIDGNVGILGSDYPGLFGTGDTGELARLLTRAETDPRFLGELRTRVKKLAPLFDPKLEERAWADLIRDLD